jgi:hypothetical protein
MAQQGMSVPMLSVVCAAMPGSNPRGPCAVCVCAVCARACTHLEFHPSYASNL